MNQNSKGITILGLGPGDPNLLTRQAWALLQSIPEVYLRTTQHPLVADLPTTLTVHAFDDLYEKAERFEQVYQQIVAEILALGQRPQGVVYAVPGNPYVAEATSPEIVRQARAQGIPVQVVEGISFLEPTCSALEIDPLPQLALLDALELGNLHHPPFPPSMPALVAQIYSPQIAAEVKLTLMAVYPDEYPVRLVHAAGTPQQMVEDLPLYEIDRSRHTGLLTTLYLPPLAPDSSFEAFQEVVAHLRAPDGCPWDREQTHQSLRSHLLEETYEAIAALDAEDPAAMSEEFGDLLLQIVLHAQIAAEDGEFSMVDVLQGIHHKLVYRHPHVFGQVQLDGAAAVLRNWEKLKEAERQANGHSEAGILDSVPQALPALIQAQSYQERVARVGFDWEQIQGVIDKVNEELQEVCSAPGEVERQAEIGDLLFAVVNLARWYHVDSESALRQTNQRFKQRFQHIEMRARQSGQELTAMTQKEMDVFWDEAKKLEGD